jgi:hypothetical protein
MAEIKGLNLTKRDVSQTINLEEMFGVSFQGERALRMAIAQKVIDHIVKRTQDGKNVSGAKLAKYHPDYVASAEFELAGKSKNEVNMTLTGAMLSQLDLLSDGPNTIRIGWEETEQILKAYNHNVGDTVTKRDFFGVTMAEAKKVILEEFGPDIGGLGRGKDDRKTIGDILGDAFKTRAVDTVDNLQIRFFDTEDE